ncbi:MAG: hypothetical protein ACR2NX_02520 [Chthoniobacterales bacterium]
MHAVIAWKKCPRKINGRESFEDSYPVLRRIRERPKRASAKASAVRDRHYQKP